MSTRRRVFIFGSIAVVVIAGGVITLILWKVVPAFTELFNSMNVDLPLPTRIVIGASRFVGSFEDRDSKCFVACLRRASGKNQLAGDCRFFESIEMSADGCFVRFRPSLVIM